MPFAPHFAALCLVFSTKMHCVLLQNALCFVANSPEAGANGSSFK